MESFCLVKGLIRPWALDGTVREMCSGSSVGKEIKQQLLWQDKASDEMPLESVWWFCSLQYNLHWVGGIISRAMHVLFSGHKSCKCFCVAGKAAPFCFSLLDLFIFDMMLFYLWWKHGCERVCFLTKWLVTKQRVPGNASGCAARGRQGSCLRRVEMAPGSSSLSPAALEASPRSCLLPRALTAPRGLCHPVPLH